jgi:hypothetical protein
MFASGLAVLVISSFITCRFCSSCGFLKLRFAKWFLMSASGLTVLVISSFIACQFGSPGGFSSCIACRFGSPCGFLKACGLPISSFIACRFGSSCGFWCLVISSFIAYRFGSPYGFLCWKVDQRSRCLLLVVSVRHAVSYVCKWTNGARDLVVYRLSIRFAMWFLKSFGESALTP